MFRDALSFVVRLRDASLYVEGVRLRGFFTIIICLSSLGLDGATLLLMILARVERIFYQSITNFHTRVVYNKRPVLLFFFGMEEAIQELTLCDYIE